MITIKDITKYLENLAPLDYQESYDNSGLIVGEASEEVRGVLISLDCTEEVVEEAIQKGCNLIISHHPIVFKGLKRFNNNNYVERTIIKAIQHKIALYAIHTNLDNVLGGVSSKIAEKLGLENQAILNPKAGLLKKLVVYVPRTHVEVVRKALFEAGAGQIGDYKDCSYNSAGYGTFTPVGGANPTIGEVGQEERVEETKIEVIFPSRLERQIIVSMYASHPYEEVAYNLFTIDNKFQFVGSGVIGNLPSPMDAETFLPYLKEKLGVQVIRHTSPLGKPIERIAVCGGAGGFLLKDAKRSGADVFVTADYKYHEFFDAEGTILIADVGHYESEQYTQELLFDLVKEKFGEVSCQITSVSTNPISYYY